MFCCCLLDVDLKFLPRALSLSSWGPGVPQGPAPPALGPDPHSAWPCGWAAPPAPRGHPGTPRHRPPDASVPSSAVRRPGLAPPWGGTTGSAHEGLTPAARGSAWGAARRTAPAGTQVDSEDRPCGHPSRSPRRLSEPPMPASGLLSSSVLGLQPRALRAVKCVA